MAPPDPGTPPSLCPACGYTLNAASPAPGQPADMRPEPGDWTVCARCTEPLVLDAALRAVAPPFGAYAALRLGDPGLHGALELTRQRLRFFNATAPGGGFGADTAAGRA